jgi:ribosomal protein S18 acetylase RimI-like enzyme
VVTNAEFPLVAEANLVHSIRLPEGLGLGELLEDVEPQLAAAGTPWRHFIEDPLSRPDDLGRRLGEAGFSARVRIAAVSTGQPKGGAHPTVEIRGIAVKTAWAAFNDLRRTLQAAEGKSGEELDQAAGFGRRRSLSSNVRYYLALIRFDPVGHIGLLAAGRTGMVVDVAVHPERRGQGIGRAMLRAMAERSRHLGHDLTCTLHDDSPEAARLAASAGFEPVSRFVSHLAGRLGTTDAPAPALPSLPPE